MTNNNNNAPPTQLSASMSTDSTQQNTDVLKGSSIIDDMFPLFTHVFQQVDIPLPLVFPFLLYFFSQVIAVSLWPWNSYWKDHDENHIVEEVRLVFFWIPKDANSTHFVIVSTVLFALNLISLILIIFQIEYFKIQRSFINFINIPIRFYFDTILLVSLTPTTITIGESFLLMCTNEFHVQYVISIILSAFSLGYELFSFTIVQSFASKSIAISNSLLLNFDPSLMIECIGGMIASTLLYFILALFEPWARLIAIAMHAAWFAYMCQYITARLPFVAQLSSGLSLSWYLDNIFGDTLMIITHFYRNVNQWFLFGFVYLTFLVGAPPFLIYLNYKQKKIVKLMNEDLKNQDDANEYFISLGLSNNKVKVLLYLRTAFQFNCTCFYNWTLVKFIIEKYTDEAVLSTCLHFVNFFPKETHLLNRIRHIILQTRKIHFATRFLLYQVENIKTLRNYSVSSASKLKIIELKTMSKQCEMMTRAAVDSTKLTPTYFENLSYKARMTRAVWMEALQNAPNNPKFCEEFTRYLVECEADFDTAIRMKHRGQIIEMGRSFSVDYCFRSMIRVFPNYLKKEIVDFNGAIIDQNKRVANKASNSVSANGSNGGNSNDQSFGKSDDDFDNEVEEFVAKQLQIQESELLYTEH
ncbi:hypothetical protein TVAG_406790 [Trichomonas vaginalis G3]|uniref:Uncharacterized protein n=1 Tax=Trichomonas vaginalis (strain ATCC PRA-98 / G3) TaxID=412133 RepID=A2FIC9_TRIV3|nr:guanylate cyclase protein [Trichomonas vaginalis G3]EAX95331.1 hypothetical protein TVAG_406790 [Trichomonas vaginalis G3]KAI5550557.1 guanylate cyclase protein [Trichomonas vaginalis G3]|eukprot:XP_001308261.1 hypothetical protein [Trichomonas vaginalis G3]